MLTPRQKVPELDLPLAGGGRFLLSEQAPANFTMLVVYRGLHCPICRNYIAELAARQAELESLGVSPIVLSMDEEARAMTSYNDWETGNLPLAYGLSEADARTWGLFISSRREGSSEPDLFCEPGLFLVRPDMTLYFAQVQSAPFTRPSLDQLLQGITFATKNNYPARGDLT